MNVGFKWRGHGLNGLGVFSTAEGLGLVNADLKILESQLHSGFFFLVAVLGLFVWSLVLGH